MKKVVNENQKSTLRNVLRYIRRYWGYVGASIILAAVMIERLFGYGEDISSLAALESDLAMWKDIDIVNAEFIEKGKQIAF